MINNRNTIKNGEHIKLTIKRMGINGEGIGYYQKTLVFIPKALPGEKVEAEITDVAHNFLRAKLINIELKSKLRNSNPPKLTDEVGGLELAHLIYPQQLKYKRLMVTESLRHFRPLGYRDYEVKPTIGMENPWHYRNKAQFQIRKVNNKIICGLYQTGTHKVIDSLSMPTQMELTLDVLKRLIKIIAELDIPIYDSEHNSGIIKTLVVRESVAFHNVQLTFVTNSRKLLHKRQLLEKIHANIPEIISVSQNFNPGDNQLVWGDETKLVDGKEYLQEKLLGHIFNLSPRAFFQLNTKQAAKLYELAIKALDPQTNDIVIDAYSGVGTIGISLANQVKQVVGSEIIPEAVSDANLNVQENHLTNVKYEVGATEELYPQWLRDGLKPTALIVDPPRTGLDQNLIKFINRSKPAKFVYVSCNPSTLARDLKTLTKVYKVKYIQPVDMFPQTPHVEAIVKLIRK